MVKIDNSNYNKVSVKTDSAVKLIETLKDLGVFKEKRKSAPRKKASLPPNDIRQEGDMGAGYTAPTQVRVEADTQNLTEEDIDSRTNALISKIRDEVAQNRIEDLQRTGNALFSLYTAVQPKIPRTQDGVTRPYDPFASERSSASTVYLLPDVEERDFSGTLNEGAPEEESLKQNTIFTQEEEPVLASGGGGGSQKTKVIYIKKDKKKRFIDNYKLEPFPLAGQFGVKAMYNYYKKFVNAIGEDEDPSIIGDASKMRQAMTEIINTTEII
jgi:hypothetical protein